jgi:hypothetical protein
MEQSYSCEDNSHLSCQEITRLLKKEYLLPYLQEPATVPYSEPNEYSTHRPALFF